MKIVGMVSSFREGRLARLAIETLLPACDLVLCFDGPVGDPGGWPRGPESNLRGLEGKLGKLIVVRDTWATDAAKRTALVAWTRRFEGPVWAVVLDGDEALLWGEYLPDYIDRVMAGDVGAETPTGGFPLRLVEMDGSVVKAHARVFRADLVEALYVSSFTFKLWASEATVALPNIPDGTAPMQGEPHILHRSAFRAPGRDAAETRLSAAELEWFRQKDPAHVSR